MSTRRAPKKPPVNLFICEVCGLKCYCQSVLKDHMNKHTGKRPYKCEKCLTTFRSVAIYRSHLKTHEKDFVTFLCDICGNSFTNEQYFRRHYLMHTSPKVFTCDICGTTFNRKSILKEHKKPTRGADLQKCRWCDCETGTIRCIEIHEKKYHAQLPTPPKPPTPQLSPQPPLDPPVLREPDSDINISTYYNSGTTGYDTIRYDTTVQNSNPYTCEIIYRDAAPAFQEVFQPPENEYHPVYHTLSPIGNTENFMDEWFMPDAPATVTTSPYFYESSAIPDYQYQSTNQQQSGYSNTPDTFTQDSTPQPLINNPVEAVETSYVPYACPHPGHTDDCYVCRFSHY